MKYIMVIDSNFARILPDNSKINNVMNQSAYFNSESEPKKIGAVQTVKITKYMLRDSRFFSTLSNFTVRKFFLLEK